MTRLPVLKFPDPRLRIKALPVVEKDPTIETLLNDMLETMYAEKGVGLAATQVGIAKRLVVMDFSGDPQSPMPMKMINPEIVKISESLIPFEERCLSVPDYWDTVIRPEEVTYAFHDLNGQRIEKTVTGLEAVCIQHEIDHLNGVLFVDHLSRLKRNRFLKVRSASRKRKKDTSPL